MTELSVRKRIGKRIACAVYVAHVIGQIVENGWNAFATEH